MSLWKKLLKIGRTEPAKPEPQPTAEATPSAASSDPAPTDPSEADALIQEPETEAEPTAAEEEAEDTVEDPTGPRPGATAQRGAKARESDAVLAQREALRRSPDAAGFAQLARLLIEDKALQTALAETVRGLAQYPDSTELLALKGDIHLGIKQWAEAETAFRQALAQTPEWPAALRGLARLAEKAKDWEQALVRWQTCQQHHPDHPDAADWRAAEVRALIRLGRHETAETLATELAASHPDRAAGPVALAQTAAARQDWEAAIQRWQTCLERFPDHGDAADWRVELAAALVQAGHHGAAKQHYRTLLDQNSHLLDAYEGLATIAEAQDQADKAIDRYQDCLALRPKHPKAKRWRFKIGNLLMKLGKLEAAECEFQALADQYPGEALGEKGLQRIAKLRSRPTKPAAKAE